MLDSELDDASDTADDTSFVQFWNTVLAPKFIRFRHILVGGLSRHSEAIFPTLPVREGDRVLDVGCGFGDTAIKLSRLVGSAGEVIGIDCCDAFLEIARGEAEASGLRNIRLMRGDAEIALPTNEFDFVFARFGTMFFANPVPMTSEARDKAVDEFIALVGAVDGILQMQASADSKYFAFVTAMRGHPMSKQESDAVERGVLKAYRWQYIVSGAQHPHFMEVLTGLTTEAQRLRIQTAIATLM